MFLFHHSASHMESAMVFIIVQFATLSTRASEEDLSTFTDPFNGGFNKKRTDRQRGACRHAARRNLMNAVSWRGRWYDEDVMAEEALSSRTGHAGFLILTHWTRVTSVNYAIIGSDNGLSPVRRHAIICTKASLLLIWHLGTNINWILIEIGEIWIFSLNEIHFIMPSVKVRHFLLAWIFVA